MTDVAHLGSNDGHSPAHTDHDQLLPADRIALARRLRFDNEGRRFDKYRSKTTTLAAASAGRAARPQPCPATPDPIPEPSLLAMLGQRPGRSRGKRMKLGRV
jgi:hypothetical protein